MYIQRKFFILSLLGFASGFSFILVSSTIPIWLATLGYSKANIGLLFLCTLPYCFKFLWAPWVDQYEIPLLSARLGKRRSWALVTQIGLFLSIVGLGVVFPQNHFFIILFCAFLIAFFAASQDTVLDAYRIETLSAEELGLGTAWSSSGFRIGMLMGGAFTLFLSNVFNWQLVFIGSAFVTLVGPFAMSLAFSEDRLDAKNKMQKAHQVQNVQNTHKPQQVQKVKNYWTLLRNTFFSFCTHPNALWIFLFILFFKMSDAIPNAMCGPMLVDLEYSLEEIAFVNKSFGVLLMIIGGFLGATLITKKGIMRGTFYCALAQGLSPLLMMILAMKGHHFSTLVLITLLQNFCSGMGTTAFGTFLASLCSKEYTATQFSVICGISSLCRILLSTTSGWFADVFEWDQFFLGVTILSLPVFYVFLKLNRRSRNLAVE